MGRLPSGAVLDLGSLRSPAGKKASIAHFAGGARNVARIKVGELSPPFVRAPVLAFFRRQNRRAFFPSLPIAALLRCQLGGGGAEIVQVEMLLRRMAGLAAPKASVVLEPMLAFVASHEACRRMAVCTR